MTDYNELVNDLREYLTTRQISDLLEAQAKEIAEKGARIAELEVALKDLREAAYDVDEMDMLFSQRNEWGCCLARADKALKGGRG